MENIEDLYVASPMQRGLIFHGLYAPESSAYFVQTLHDLKGELNPSAFEQAWQRVLDRHSILRTSFVWEEMDEVLQVVHRRLDLPWRNYDWRGLPEAEQESRLEEFLEEDRRLRLDLTEAPLSRMTLIRLGDRRWKFIWSHHHALLDGWSAFVVLKQAFDFYEAILEGRDPHLPPARPYRDYVAWLERQDIAAAERFWRERLRGLDGTAPSFVQRHAESGPEDPSEVTQQQGYRHDTYLSEELTDALRSMAKRHQLTLNTLMQGAWALLLARYSGTRDVVFGTVVSGRPPELEGVEEMVGPFINLLPVRVRVEGGEELVAWLRRLQAEQSEMREYEYSPLSEVQGWSDVPRGVPLFDSIMSFHNYPIDVSARGGDGGLRVTQVSSVEKTNYPLSLNVMPGAGLHLQVSYDGARLGGEQARQMLGHLERILEQMAAHPARLLRDFSPLTEAEERRLLVEWNGERHEYPAARPVPELFEERAARTPEAPAVSSDEGALTYGELNERANQLAHYLRRLGVGPEVVVGVLMERSVELVTTLLGILKAGGAYLPIDPAYPQQRQAWMLRDAGARALVMRDWPAEGFPDYEGHLVSLDIFGDAIAGESTENPAAEILPENLAYVIYTSGSTGQPKGVSVGHGALLNLVFWHRRYYEVTPADRATQLAGVGFDASVWELWPYLTAGASVHVPDEDVRSSPGALRDWMVEQGITISFLPTPLAENVLSLEWPQGGPLRAMLTGGDRLHQHPDPSLPFKLFNNYGPTENAVVATSGLVPASEGGGREPSIGRPIHNTETYLLDNDLQPVPAGVAAEIYIGGDSLARGYLNRPGLTAERFVPHPFSTRPGARLYRTGDVARHLPGGEIEFIGRRDDQVKVRGFRIELGEVEAVLRQHASVREAAVVSREGAAGQRQLVAYVVGAHGTQGPEPGELKEYLRERLPDYMVPSAFVLLDSLPLTANGKLDRRALPAPDEAQDASGDGRYEAPRTEAERVLCEVWAQVLGRERVGVRDNFFDLGGDSILSIQVVARANRAGLRLSPKQLFDQPTVAALAASAGNSEATSAEDEVVTGELLLTPIQRMFFKWKIVDRNHYNQAVMLKVKHGTDLGLLRQALQHLIDYHDGLRLRFMQTEEGWKAHYVPSDTLSWREVDLSHITDADERKAAIESEAAATQATPDIVNGPMMRTVYFDCGEDEPARLLIVIHHLTVDGVSWRILVDDLQRAYGQLAAGESIDLGPKTTSFQRWSRELIKQTQTPERQAELAYWTGQAWWRARPLPLDSPGEGMRLSTARALRLSLSAAETEALLREVPEAYHTQINEVLLAALGRALGAWAGEGEVVVDLEGHGREEMGEGVDVSRTVGWFTAIFPVLLRMDGGEEVGAALRRVKEQLRGIPRRGVGFGMLKYLSEDEAVRNRMRQIPGAQLNFNYLGQFDQVADSDAVISGAAESCGPAQSLKNPLPTLITVNSTVHGRRLEMVWTYSEVVHRRETLEWLAERYMDELREIIAHCRNPEAGGFTVSDFPLAGLSEEQFGRVSALISELSDD